MVYTCNMKELEGVGNMGIVEDECNLLHWPRS